MRKERKRPPFPPRNPNTTEFPDGYGKTNVWFDNYQKHSFLDTNQKQRPASSESFLDLDYSKVPQPPQFASLQAQIDRLKGVMMKFLNTHCVNQQMGQSNANQQKGQFQTAPHQSWLY